MMRDVLIQALDALRYNRRRALLTMLGMAWGIATVVLLLSYGDGFGNSVRMVLGSVGLNAIGIFPGRTSMQAGGIKAGTFVHFTQDDVDRLANELPGIRHITPLSGIFVNVQHGERIYQLPVRGCYPYFLDIRHFVVEDGRGLTDEDEVGNAHVAVIGDDAEKKLFAGEPAIGQTIRINGIPYQVIGVMEHKIQEGDINDNSFVLTPFTSFGALHDTHYLDGIWLNYDSFDPDALERRVRQSLASHHGFKPQDRRAIFVANTAKDMAEITLLTDGIKVLLTFIGVLTLGIGGVSLMNIMLVSVSQRTREIGVEKALGARRRHILFQFLAEALAITFAGGLLGVVIAYIVSFTVGSLTLWSAFIQNAEAADIHLRINLQTLAIATGILCVVGLVSGMLPAIRASRLSPIEALRYE